MKTIYKYPLSFPTHIVYLPEGCRIVKLAEQDGAMYIWAIVDTGGLSIARRFTFVGTGHPLPVGEYEYIDTIFQGPFVWHLFVSREAAR
jgi:hypothetical protein